MVQCLQSLCSAYRAIIVGVQVFQCLHETSAHVSCFCGLDSSVHQALPARHGMEEELGGTEATVEGGCHKALALRGFVPTREVGQTAILQTASSQCHQHHDLPSKPAAEVQKEPLTRIADVLYQELPTQ